MCIRDSARGSHERGHEVSAFTGKPDDPEGSFFPGCGVFGRMSGTCEGMRVIRVPRLLDSA